MSQSKSPLQHLWNHVLRNNKSKHSPAARRDLVRLWNEARDRFGVNSTEAADVGAIMDYWDSKGWGKESESDAIIKTKIAGYRNECIRDQGKQPWDYPKSLDDGNITNWWYPPKQR